MLNFAQPISGDYAHLVSGDGDHDYVYSVYPGFVLIDRVEGSAAIDTASFPSGESYAWLPPLAGGLAGYQSVVLFDPAQQ